VAEWENTTSVNLDWECHIAILATNQPGMDIEKLLSQGTKILDCTNSIVNFNNLLNSLYNTTWKHIAWSISYNPNGPAIWKIYLNGIQIYNDFAPLNTDTNNGYPLTGVKTVVRLGDSVYNQDTITD
jgi:hypothetical protein